VIPQQITSERLVLRLITRLEAADMLAGNRRPEWHRDYPRPDDQDAVSMLPAAGADEVWGPRHVVRAFDGLVVGSLGFFGPPAVVAGVEEAEIGYGLVAEARGRGVAFEALRAVLCETDQSGVRVRASVEPSNAASLRVLAKCGFTELRCASENGELVMARPFPA
jgi:[ribosomal protein S5]-alanine N-acetyltransferase